MAYLVVIRGPLGVGKTTIAHQLAQEISAHYISIDEVLVENGLDRSSGDFDVQDFIKANNFIIPRIKKKLSANQSVVLDGNFYFLEPIEQLVNEVPVPVHVFTLKAPLNVCILRDSQRDMSYGKEAATAVYDLVKRFDYGEAIDASNSIQNTINAILIYLKDK